jgi:hypothetical protein
MIFSLINVVQLIINLTIIQNHNHNHLNAQHYMDNYAIVYIA